MRNRISHRAGLRALASPAALALALAPVMPAAAHAQAGGDSVEQSDIVVTARRVEERLQDVPISITVFNQQQLTDRNMVNAQDLAIYTPSLAANTNFGTENSSFALRGFVQDIGTAPSVGVYFADVVAPRGSASGIKAGDGAGPGYFYDLQNVQVLKGPQGTLFGRNTTGGAILFVPQKPTDRFEGFVEGSLGNYDMRRLQGAVNAPLGDGARLRIAGDLQQRDGYLKNYTGIGPDAVSDVDYWALRASLVMDLTPDLENYLIASYSKSHTNGFLQKVFACNPANPLLGAVFACPQLARAEAAGRGFHDVPNNIPAPSSNLEQWQVINTTTWQVSDTLTVKNIVSYAQLKQRLSVALFGLDWSVAGQPLNFANIRPAPGSDTAHQSTFTEEIQLQGSAFAQRLTYQLGAYLEISDPRGLAGAQSPNLVVCTDVDTLQCTDYLGMGAGVNIGGVNYTVGRTSFRNIGLYAQATYDLTEQLKLTGGFRYTWDRQSNTSRRITYTFPIAPPFTDGPTARCTDAAAAPSCEASVRAESDKPTWLIGLDYKPVDDVLLYAKYARGYRAGGVFPNAPAGSRTFEPEKVDTYELGFKSSFDGAVRGTFNVAAFYNDFTNQQLQVGYSAAPGRVASNTTGVVNAGRSRIYGAEVEASIRPFEGFSLDASYAWLHATIRSIAPLVSNDPNYVVSATIQAGNDLVLSPRNKFTVTANYRLPVDESVGTVSFGATFTHVGSQRSNYAYNNPAVVAAFGADYGRLAPLDLLNLNVNWSSVAGSPVDLSFFATNVTNEKYYSFIPGLAGAGFESAILGEPRMYGFRVRYRFGQ